MKRRIGAKWIVGIAVALSASLGFWLACGIYADREFGMLNLFLKHRISTRFYFYAPLGESDDAISSLPPEQQHAEADFEEFVERHDGYKRRIPLE